MNRAALYDLTRYIETYEDYQRRRVEIAQHGKEIVGYIRAKEGLSINKFAILIGVSPSYLSKLEKGKEVLPPDIAKKLLDVHKQTRLATVARQKEKEAGENGEQKP